MELGAHSLFGLQSDAERGPAPIAGERKGRTIAYRRRAEWRGLDILGVHQACAIVFGADRTGGRVRRAGIAAFTVAQSVRADYVCAGPAFSN